MWKAKILKYFINRVANAEKSLKEERAKCAKIERLLQRSQLAGSAKERVVKQADLSDSVKLPSLGPDLNFNCKSDLVESVDNVYLDADVR